MKKFENYLEVTEQIPSILKDNVILDIKTNNVTSFTHGFHKYPAKFIPQIPGWAISKYLSTANKKIILDPFCGSGTTLVQGLLANHNVIGFDIDPLSVLISKVKTTKLNKDWLLKVYDWLTRKIQDNSTEGKYLPECKTIKHWFNESTIEKLSKIRTAIDDITDEFGNNEDIKNIQDFFYIAFSSVLRRVSNADNESQKTYVSHTNIKTPEEPLELFFRQTNLYIDRIIEFSEKLNNDLKGIIYCEDSSKPLNGLLNEYAIDLIVTSPPYIKAIDYIYNQMAELFWIGDIFQLQTQDKQNKRKKIYIGSKHFHKKDYENFSPFEAITDIPELDEKLQKVYSVDKKNGHKHSYLTYKYFTDMEKHFYRISEILDSKKHYIMVIGDSSVSNIYFNTSELIAKIAARNGFKLINRWGYKIKNRYMRFDRKGRGGIIKVDWVLDFEKI